MGCDIVAIANHSLDTSGIEQLAAGIAARLQAWVVYGCYSEDYDFVPQGEAGSGGRLLHLSSDPDEADAPGAIACELYDARDYQGYHCHIYRDCFRVPASYGPGRYGMFCDSFTGRYRYWESELQYRTDVYAAVTALGGDTAIYAGDQCGASFVSYDADDNVPFAAILAKVSALANVVYISDWLRNFPGIYLAAHPPAFIDDFTYLPAANDIISKCR